MFERIKKRHSRSANCIKANNIYSALVQVFIYLNEKEILKIVAKLELISFQKFFKPQSEFIMRGINLEMNQNLICKMTHNLRVVELFIYFFNPVCVSFMHNLKFSI